MRYDILLPLMAAFPMAAAAPVYALGKNRPRRGLYALIAATAMEALLCLAVFLSPGPLQLQVPSFMGLGISFYADGFRMLYAAVACLMWLMTSLFSPQYLSHGHRQARYAFFTLLTLGATVGVFLSDDLITCFFFFEIVGFTSYCWVVHEETPAAMRAGQTYLAVAVSGGMAMLMGLWLLDKQLGTLRFEELAAAAAKVSPSQLYLPGALILAGFGAKAGMYPLHIWLPKAHPVAPAPASALLSGVLTKVGVFGILVLSTRVFHANAAWGNVLLMIGLVNMFLGALLALMSVDLKRTLACSSMSQIGFILVGIGMQNLLGPHNSLAAEGTILHMLNHSLIKLLLFMAAGVVYVNAHSLSLNDIRGWGRRHHGLKLLFLIGACSLSGIPLFSGYDSKTLLHESIVEYIVHLSEHGLPMFWYQAAEWVFIVSGGMTFCYMLKLFITIFVEKHPTRQMAYDAAGSSMTPLSALALSVSAAVVLVLGLAPEKLMIPIADSTLSFMLAHRPEHAVRFLTWVNISGALKSLVIGLALYLTVVRHVLTAQVRQTHALTSLNRWPDWLDLENLLYRPLVSGLKKLGFLICAPLDTQMDGFFIPLMYEGGSGLAGTLNGVLEGTVYLLRRLALGRRAEPYLEEPDPRVKAAAKAAGGKAAQALRRAEDGLAPRLQKSLWLLKASASTLKEFCLRHAFALLSVLAGLAAAGVALYYLLT